MAAFNDGFSPKDSKALNVGIYEKEKKIASWVAFTVPSKFSSYLQVLQRKCWKGSWLGGLGSFIIVMNSIIIIQHYTYTAKNMYG